MSEETVNGDASNSSMDNDKRTSRSVIPQIAKERLSKWAARLFDPDRPKGLIQPPQIIPLNDEFLKAFGKREKETDAARGISVDIENIIEDEEDEQEVMMSQPSTNKAKSMSSRKIKITNIKFTTTQETLETACQKFGPLENVALIMNKDDETKNAGFAYITFETSESALGALSGLTAVDGRPVATSIATSSGMGSTRSAQTPSRYFGASRDLSTKCFRCGQIGHMAADCPNEKTIAPCPLCAAPHELRDCPNKAICFNCGIPGHVSRNCNERRGLPPRKICTICYLNTHFGWQCRRRAQPVVPPSAPAAVCMSCGKTGHYLCRPVKFFFGLKGVSCGNCGVFGHIGPDCKRPNAEACRNAEVTKQEIDRAASVSFVEQQIIRLNEPGGANRGQEPQRGNGQRQDNNRNMPPRQRSDNSQKNRNNGNSSTPISRKRKQGNR